MNPEWDKVWEKLLSIVEVNCKQDWDVLTHFLRNLDNFSRVMLLSGCLKHHTPVTQSDVLSLFMSKNYIKSEIDFLPEVPEDLVVPQLAFVQ